MPTNAYDERLLSLSCGILLVRGLPAAAVSAGWKLSALVGPSAGDVFAVIIFILGVSAVNITEEIAERKLTDISKLIISALYAINSGVIHNHVIDVSSNHILPALSGIIDSVVILFLLNTAEENAQRVKFLRVIITLAAWLFFAFTDFVHLRTEALHPLVAALISGTAISHMIKTEYKISWLWMLSGMSGVMLFDALF